MNIVIFVSDDFPKVAIFFPPVKACTETALQTFINPDDSFMTINCRGNLIDLSTPKVMGILNVTPDSFFDGGRYGDEISMLRKTEQMLEDGADFIDIGGYSSRPGADDIPEAEEMRRVIPAITSIVERFPEAVISADTFRSGIARAAVEAGASIVNDISAGSFDSEMMETVADLRVPYIMMHMRGTPKTMSGLTDYDNLITDVLFYFSEKIAQARSLGISDIIIDPGFGFAKTLEQNYEMLGKLELLQAAGLPVLVGMSRKGMIQKLLDVSANEALNGTTAANMVALEKGANILRVHDVRAAAECVRIFRATANSKRSGDPLI